MKPVTGYSQDTEVLEIDFALIMHILKRQYVFLLCLAIVGIVAGVIFVFFIHKDKYVSETTILVSQIDSPNIVNNYPNPNNFFKGIRPTSNPFKNQIELIRSRFMGERVLKQLKEQKALPPINNLPDLIDDALLAEHIRDTDIVKLSVIWDNPKNAKKIADVYIQNYLNLVQEITLTPLVKQRNNLEIQVDKAEQELAEINDKLQSYQETSGIVDIDIEGNLLLNSVEDLKTEYNKITAAMAQKQAEMAKIKNQLNLDTQSAINSVANGQNVLYTNLIAKLNELQQDYNIKGLTFAPTNPDMVNLKEQIAVLKNQIENQEVLTIGRKLKINEIVITDDVRRDLVKRMAGLEAEYSSLKDKWSVIKEQLSDTESNLEKLPVKQVTYSRLVLERKNKEDILTRLKTNLAQAKIQEASIQENIRVIDTPNMPTDAIFPNKIHLLLLITLASLVIPAGASVSLQYITNKIARPQFLEKVLNIPVLAVIPWLPENLWKIYRVKMSLKECSGQSYESIVNAYQSLVIKLRTQKKHSGEKALAVAPTYTEDIKSSTVMLNLALFLAQSGDRVVMVDANLRSPKLSISLGENLNFAQGLTETINELSEYLFNNQDVSSKELLPLIQKQLLPTEIHKNVVYLNAGIKLEDTFEFLNTKGFEVLVNTLKDNYDWVLFDSPALLHGSDTYVILRNLDGLLLLVERQATKQQVEMAVKQVWQVGANIIGAVLRDLEDDSPTLLNTEFYHFLPESTQNL